MCDQKLEDQVQYALQNYNLSNYKIEVDGRTGKGDCFLSDVTFVKVSGTTKSGVKKTLNMAVKATKQDEKLREVIPVRKAFLKEIFIYDVLKPHFEKLLQEKGSKRMIDIMPFCYNTCTEKNKELIVFENLTPQGYRVWDKAVPWTFEQTRLVLEAYGFWHSLSVAFRILKPEIFKEITRDNVNMFSYFIVKSKLYLPIIQAFEKARNMAVATNEEEILQKLQFSKEEIRYAFNELYFEGPDDHVILHGDCWNNNFMFKNMDNDPKLAEVRILDWQCSGLGSPVLDLSHFIYCSCDTGKHQDVKEFLKIYYNSFSQNLRLLGCEPVQVFPFEKLVEHWKTFSRMGLFMSCIVIKVCLMNTQDVPDFVDLAGREDEYMENYDYKLENEKEYTERVRNNFTHYARNLS